MYYILYPHNTVSWGKGNVIKKPQGEKIHLKYFTVFIGGKRNSVYKWTPVIQTHVLQGQLYYCFYFFLYCFLNIKHKDALQYLLLCTAMFVKV